MDGMSPAWIICIIKGLYYHVIVIWQMVSDSPIITLMVQFIHLPN